MNSDPNSAENAIEEIRESRCRMSEQCGHDLGKYIEYLKTFNDRYSAQVAAYLKPRSPQIAEFGPVK
jgi:hypothetical protein